MELRHLRYYVAVAEELHFGRAAERLHMAQPPLSQQIKQLEQDLGATLLERSTRKVELTAAGQAFLERARGLLAELDSAVEETRTIAAGLGGRIAIGFTGSATYELLPALARVLHEETPDLRLELKGELLTPVQVEALLDHSIDIGFLRPPVRNAALEVRVLRREPLIAVLPESHRLATGTSVRLADLRDEPFITYPAQHKSVVYDAVLDACESAGYLPAHRIEVSETSTLVSFVAAGLGVALVPASVRHLSVTGATYRPLAPTTQEVALAIAARKGDTSPQVAHVLARTRSLLG
jgi:DNA-binding transcriptional LysR family regulator